MNPTFSHDLIVEILLRLPIKSLLRFKCVCKSWLSFISDPHFVKSHLVVAPTNQTLLDYDFSICPNPSGMHIWGIKFFSCKTNSEGRKLRVTLGIHWPGPFFNGALHWLALTSNKKHFGAIIAYDLRQRSFSEIPLPHDLTMEVKSKIFSLMLTAIKGCLCLCHNFVDNERAEVWMMKEYKLQSSWTKFLIEYASIYVRP